MGAELQHDAGTVAVLHMKVGGVKKEASVRVGILL